MNNDSNVMIFSSSYGNSCNAGYTSLCYQIDREIILNPSLIKFFLVEIQEIVIAAMVLDPDGEILQVAISKPKM